MRVLLTHPKIYYVISDCNPKVGSEFECIGTVISFYKERNNYALPDLSICVKWDNGEMNYYRDGELSVIDTDEECISIW